MPAVSSVQESLAQVYQLEQTNLPDNGTNIDTPAVALAYSYINNLNFADDKVYAPTSSNVPSYFSKETFAMAKLNYNLEIGHRFLATLYSYRSVARGIPQVSTTQHDQTIIQEMNKLSYEILKPEIAKIKDLSKYCDECTLTLATVFKTMIPEYKEGFASTEFLIVLAKTLDLILVIDVLKNAKASLNNDFSIYKRISNNLKNVFPEISEEQKDQHVIYTFLATQNIFAAKVKERLNDAPGYDDILVDLVNTCTSMFENQQYLIPEEKHMLLKAITFGLFLLDIPGEANDITKNKKLKLERFGKLLKNNPVVPFFGDMTMSLTTIFIKTPKLNQQRWEYDPNDDSIQKHYLLSHHIDTIRSDFKDYLLNFKASINSAKIAYSRKEPFSIEDCANIYHVLFRGLQLLSDITCKVLEQSAWKYTNPTNAQKNPNCPPDAKLYEMAVRYNYSQSERIVLCEVIGFIKILSSQLSSVPGYIFESVQKHIYHTIQQFVKNTLKDMISHVSKKKKASLSLIQHLFGIMSDKDKVIPDGEDKTKKEAPSVTLKAAGASLTQLHYIRVLLDAAINEKSKGMQGGFLKEKDFKDNHVTEVTEFLNKTYFFPHMLTYGETVRKCSDLSELWYREFYLELTKEIQFPIEMSLPWILTETALVSEYQPAVEYVLYPFDIYNDAANRALHILKSRYLYDEIEAEVNLCFDQLIWILSHKIFTLYRLMASSLILDQSFRKDAEARVAVTDNRHGFDHLLYASILKQKRFYLLGRYLDIGKLMANFCAEQFRHSVEHTISRFEGSNLTGIIELEKVLECTRLSHKLLSEHLELDPIDDIIAECDESLSLISHNGRIVSHIVNELIFDVFPNYCYNSITQRAFHSSFVPTTFSVSGQPQRAPIPRAIHMYLFGSKQMNLPFNKHLGLFKEFIGTPHLLAMMRIIGLHHIPILIGEVSQHTETNFKGLLLPYVRALIKGMPHSSKLPPFEYGSRGCFDYFQLILKPIMGYRDLKSGVFHVFKDFGNSVVFFHLMEGIAKSHNVLESIHIAPLLGMRSQVSGTIGPESFIVQSALDFSSEAIGINGNTMDFKNIGHELFKYYSFERDYNYLGMFLKNITPVLNELRQDWEPRPIGEDEIVPDFSTEFYRLWSSLLFVYSIPPPSATENPNRSMYGDGFMWSGTAITHIFKEDKRFEAFDFISFLNHIFNMEKNSATTVKGSSGHVDLAKFFDNSEHNQMVVNEALHVLRSRLMKEKL